MKTKLTFAVFSTSAVLTMSAQYPTKPSTNDLWDISQGVTITAHSPFDAADGRPNPYDARDMFGGMFDNFPGERGAVVFDDDVPANFIHYVEWRTPAPVTIRSFNVFASGDEFGREFARFTLKAKSPGSPTFDLALYTFTPQHPYRCVDAQCPLVVSTDIEPVTAQDFRAEFANLSGQSLPGPRIIELDGFSQPRGPQLSIAVSCIDLCWNSISNKTYQVQYRSDLTTNMWTNLGAPVLSTGPATCVTDSVRGQERRFYRVFELP